MRQSPHLPPAALRVAVGACECGQPKAVHARERVNELGLHDQHGVVHALRSRPQSGWNYRSQGIRCLHACSLARVLLRVGVKCAIAPGAAARRSDSDPDALSLAPGRRASTDTAGARRAAAVRSCAGCAPLQMCGTVTCARAAHEISAPQPFSADAGRERAAVPAEGKQVRQARQDGCSMT